MARDRHGPSKLDAFKPYIEERLKAGVWNEQVLLRELRPARDAGVAFIALGGFAPSLAVTRF